MVIDASVRSWAFTTFSSVLREENVEYFKK